MRAAAFFDIDGTLLRGESQFSFLLWCIRRGVVPVRQALPVVARYAGYLAGVSADARQLRESGYRLFRGVSVTPIEREAEMFFRENLATRFRQRAMSLIEAHRANGHRVVLITSACVPVARLVMTELRADALIATHLVTDGGVFTGTRELPEPYGKGKQELAEFYCKEHNLAPAESWAYADHHSDVNLLELVGHPVVVHPTDKLRRTAQARGWPVIDLEQPTAPTIELVRNRNSQPGVNP